MKRLIYRIGGAIHVVHGSALLLIILISTWSWYVNEGSLLGVGIAGSVIVGALIYASLFFSQAKPMQHLVNKGENESKPRRKMLWNFKEKFKATVSFYEEDLAKAVGGDVSKLIGLSFRFWPVITRIKEGMIMHAYGPNKLLQRFGLAFFWGHHWSSVRLGVRFGKGLEYKLYIYEAGHRRVYHLQTVPFDLIRRYYKNIQLSIEYTPGDSSVKVVANGFIAFVNVGGKIKIGYVLNPYIGGAGEYANEDVVIRTKLEQYT